MEDNKETNEVQRQREAFTQQIRKVTREEKFSKRRNLNSKEPTIFDTYGNVMQEEKSQKKPLIIDEQRRDIILNFIESKYTLSQLPQLIQNIHSQNIDLKHRGVIGVRKIISVDNDPPIQEIIDAQLVPIFINMTKQTTYPQIQLEATWILTNVCSGTTHQCESVIEKGGIPIFVDLLIQNRSGVVDQAVWAVGNLSGDCVKYRDMILKAGALEQLIKIANSTKDKNLLRQVAWTISNLCRGTPLPKYDYIKNGVVCLCQIVKSGVLDRENLIDSLWAISYSCESTKSKIQRVVETGVVGMLIRICDSDDLNVMTPGLRILGNISVGNQLQTEELLKNGLLELFNKLIENQRKTIRREVCWIISNITAGTKSQIQQFLNNYILLKKVLHLFQTDVNEVKKEICYIFSNMIHLGDKQIVFNLYVSQKLVEYYAKMLIDVSSDVKTIEAVLDTLFNFLSAGQKVKTSQNDKNVLVDNLISIPGVIDVIEKLQYHESKVIYNKTIQLLQKYFDLEQDMDL